MSAKNTTKLVKHRASIACERCRVRKVRCDIVIRKGKCTNCLLDKLDCIQPGPRRRRGTRSRPHPPMQAPPAEEAHSPAMLDNSGCSPANRIQDAAEQSVKVSELSLDGGPGNHGQTVEAPVVDSNEDLFPDFIGNLQIPQLAQSTLASRSPKDGGFPEDLQAYLPAFAAPVRSQRLHKYADFLEAHGAFSIPPPRLIAVLLTRYVECVHPQLPLLDTHDVLHAVATNGEEGKVSFLLFQAMLLAASASVDTSSYSEAGYHSRMVFRKEQAEHVRLLYDFDFESDRLILVQCLILMTSWQDKGDEVKHLRHWISIAYNMSVLLGLNKESPPDLKISAKQKSLRKRIWWSLYMRDRTLSLGLRQWPIIASEASEISEPCVEDFHLRPASARVCQMLQDCPLLQDLDQQVLLTEAFRAQLQLTHNVLQVFKARYTVVTPKMGNNHMIALVLVPSILDHTAHATQKCSAILDEWFKTLANRLRYQIPLSLHFRPGEDILGLHCGILNLFYYALVCALHRPYPSPTLSQASALDRNSRRKARHAANAIFSIVKEFQASDSIGLLPTHAITFMLQATVTSLCDAASTVAQLRATSRSHLKICLEILNDLKTSHSYALYAINFVRAAAASFNRQLHALVEPALQPKSPAAPQEPELFQVPSPPLYQSRGELDNLVTDVQGMISSSSRELGSLLNLDVMETPQYTNMIDPGSQFEAADFGPGWEFFLDPVNDLCNYEAIPDQYEASSL